MLKNPNTLSLEKITKYIIKEYHDSNRKILEKLKTKITDISDEDYKTYPKLSYLGELFIQFKSEYLKHMEKEEITTFPTIIKYEKIINSKGITLFQGEKQHLNYIEMKNEHDNFNSYLTSIISLFEGLEFNKKIKNLYNIFVDIQKKNIEHSNLENDIVYPKGTEFQDKLLGKN